jgi:ATP-dependent Zn protease
VIDSEVQRIVTEQYTRAQALLKEHQAAHKTLAQELLKQETVSGSDVKEALENGALSPTGATIPDSPISAGVRVLPKEAAS